MSDNGGPETGQAPSKALEWGLAIVIMAVLVAMLVGLVSFMRNPTSLGF